MFSKIASLYLVIFVFVNFKKSDVKSHNFLFIYGKHSSHKDTKNLFTSKA